MSHASSPWSKRIKLALIPLLALTLGWVVLGSKQDDASATAGPRVKQPLPEIPQQGGRVAQAHQDADFGKVDLSAVLAFNPFAEPVTQIASSSAATGANGALTASSDPTSTSTGGEQANGEQPANGKRVVRHVYAVVQHNGRACAFLDGEFVAEGDTLADGSRVVSITAERVTLEAN
jgi:hypothetical protein